MEAQPSIATLFPYGTPSENEDKRYPNTEDTQRVANYANQVVDQYLEAKPNLAQLTSEPHLELTSNSNVAGAAIDTLNFIAQNDSGMRESELSRSEQKSTIKEKYGITDAEAESLYLQFEKSAKNVMVAYPNMNFEDALRYVGENLTEDMVSWIKSTEESNKMFSDKVTTIREATAKKQKEVETDQNQIIFLK